MGVVHFLKSLTVACFAGHVTHKQHHRRGVLESGMHANGCVGGTRSTGHKANARSPCEFALRLGHESRPPLLPTGHKLNAVAVQVKAIQHRQITFTGNAKSMGNALGQEAFNEQVAGNF